MNEETIDYRLDQIEKKLDCVTNLLLQTQGQEYRITALEKKIGNMSEEKKTNTNRWLNPLISAIISSFVSGIVAFIFVKVGLK